MNMDSEELYVQCLDTTLENLKKVSERIDGVLGEGYAAKHSDLVGAVLIASHIDYYGTLLSVNVDFAGSSIVDVLDTHINSAMNNK